MAKAIANHEVGNTPAVRDRFKTILLGTAAVAIALSFADGATQETRAQSAAAPKSKAQGATYNIPPQSLGSALTSFADRAGLRLLFASNVVAGKTSPGLSGTYSRQQALSRLLAGSGLSYRFTSANTVTIENPAAAGNVGTATVPGAIALDTIDVQGAGTGVNPNSTLGNLPPEHAGGQVATGAQVGMLGNRSVMNTPFSQTSYTNRTIQDQQAQTLQDVLSNDPSVVTSGRSSGNFNETTTIRGFSDATSRGSGSLNGLVGLSPLNSPDMSYIERVEVLRGPSALLNGMSANGQGGIGGTVNLRTKQAGDDPLTQLTTSYASRSLPGVHLDFGRRFGDQKQFGLRFNGGFRKGDTPVTPQSTEIGLASLNLDYRGERIRLSADVAHQGEEASTVNMQMLGLGNIRTIPAAPDAGTSLNPPWGKMQSRSTMAMLRAEVDVSDNVTAYGAIGKQRWDSSMQTAYQPMLLDTSGTYRWAALYNLKAKFEVLSMQGGLRAIANTGAIEHKLSLNLSQTQMRFGQATQLRPYSHTTNIYNPIHGPAQAFGDLADPLWTNERIMSSAGVADTMSLLDDRIQFTAGLRYQKVENRPLPTGEPYISNALTPAFGLVVKPLENVSVYANYIQALQPGAVVTAMYANAGDVLPPYLSEQYEAGVKVDWGTVTTTFAVFDITQASAISIPAPGGGLPTLAADGEQRNRGVELSAYGALTDNIRLMGGITFLDARLTKTQNGLYDGNRAEAAPSVRAVVGAEWDTPFVEGLTLIGRFSFTGDQVVSNTNDDLKIPSWTTVDLGARYTFASSWNAQPIAIRFNVDNVFDQNYWSMGTSNILYLGAPRTYRLSATFNF